MAAAVRAALAGAITATRSLWTSPASWPEGVRQHLSRAPAAALARGCPLAGWQTRRPTAEALSRAALCASPAARQQPGMESAPASASTSAAWQPHGPSPRAPGARAARGPLGLYQAGIAEGRYRHDDRQDSAMRLLQALFVKLEARYPRKKRPSNLTMVDNVATARSKNSWCATPP